MRAGSFKIAAIIGLGTLSLFSPAPADPSDDLAGPAAGTNSGGGLTDKNNIEIVDPDLESRVELLKISSTRADNNLLQVFATLRNKSARQLDIEVETIYKDQSGNELNTGSWMHFTLKPREAQDYRSAAIQEAAVDFLIRIRRAPASAAH